MIKSCVFYGQRCCLLVTRVVFIPTTGQEVHFFPYCADKEASKSSQMTVRFDAHNPPCCLLFSGTQHSCWSSEPAWSMPAPRAHACTQSLSLSCPFPRSTTGTSCLWTLTESHAQRRSTMTTASSPSGSCTTRQGGLASGRLAAG